MTALRFSSLRWRIATWYALLLVAAMAATGVLVAWRLQAILLADVRARLTHLLDDVVQTTSVPNPLGLQGPSAGGPSVLLDPANLARWESSSTFLQVDTPDGYPLAKSDNLGSAVLPPPPPAAAGRSAGSFATVTVGGRPFLVGYRRIAGGTQTPLLLIAAEPLDQLQRAFAQIRLSIATIVAATALAVFVLSFVLAERAVGPINALARAMSEIGSERLDRRLRWEQRNDEIGMLARSFDDLLARLEEAFARERQFISDASHELKTPLTSINANAQLLLRWGDRDEVVRRESLETIARESAALAAMVNGMLLLAKADRGDVIAKEPLSLSAVADDAVRSVVQRAADKGLGLRFAPPERAPIVYGEPNLLRQAIANLIDNAVKFTERGEVRVRVGSDGGWAWVEVEDTGPGIPPEDQPRIFDRFFRSDRARSRDVPGTGLGLAIVRSIARVHGGRIEVGSGPEGGARFRLVLPREEAARSDLTPLS